MGLIKNVKTTSKKTLKSLARTSKPIRKKLKKITIQLKNKPKNKEVSKIKKKQEIDIIIQENKVIKKIIIAMTKKIDSVIRLLSEDQIATLKANNDPILRRFKIYSQNEEDGILFTIFNTLGAPHKKFVEIGSGGSGGNSGFLAVDLGWRGIMVEANRENYLRAQLRFFGYDVDVVNAFITAENVNEIIESHGLGGDIDMLSIDIDGNDYWIWDAITACNPRVVIMEYNWRYGPGKSVTIPYKSDFYWRDFGLKGYHGASLTALTKLAEKKGYSLILCDPSGTNAFFLRDDLLKHFKKRTPVEAFRIHDTALIKDKISENTFDLYDKIRAKKLPLIEV